MSIFQWQVIDSGIRSGPENMETDRKLLKSLESSQNPILHFYDWNANTATFGHFMDPLRFINPSLNLQLVKRPTGGGILFHLWDFTFSLLIPVSHPAFLTNTLENYAFVNHAVAEAVKTVIGTDSYLHKNLFHVPHNNTMHFCMANPVEHDVMYEKKKISGGAQRRTRFGYLHQGTISIVAPDSEFLSKAFLPGVDIAESIKESSYAFLPANASPRQIQSIKTDLKASLQNIFCRL